jgi:hypothetical protein
MKTTSGQGLALGVAIGISIGIALDNVGVGVGIGAAIGLTLFNKLGLAKTDEAEETEKPDKSVE